MSYDDDDDDDDDEMMMMMMMMMLLLLVVFYIFNTTRDACHSYYSSSPSPFNPRVAAAPLLQTSSRTAL